MKQHFFHLELVHDNLLYWNLQNVHNNHDFKRIPNILQTLLMIFEYSKFTKIAKQNHTHTPNIIQFISIAMCFQFEHWLISLLMNLPLNIGYELIPTKVRRSNPKSWLDVIVNWIFHYQVCAPNFLVFMKPKMVERAIRTMSRLFDFKRLTTLNTGWKQQHKIISGRFFPKINQNSYFIQFESIDPICSLFFFFHFFVCLNDAHVWWKCWVGIKISGCSEFHIAILLWRSNQ